jgi:ferredoxin/flavodoxin---NADP+ reductase
MEVSARPRVHHVRSLTESAYVLRFDRRDMVFEPGQYVSVGIRGDINMREYSIYSGTEEEDYLEILVKEVDQGRVSRQLKRLNPGDEIEVGGPFGFFMIDPEVRRNGHVIFVATGTGISPFHCFAMAYPKLDYRLLHGVRTLDERYDYDAFDPTRVTTCVSREPALAGQFAPTSVPGEAAARAGMTTTVSVQGRVTDFLRANPVDPDTRCYLCGNCDMIYESFDILKGHGVPPEQLFAEVYF